MSIVHPKICMCGNNNKRLNKLIFQQTNFTLYRIIHSVSYIWMCSSPNFRMISIMTRNIKIIKKCIQLINHAFDFYHKAIEGRTWLPRQLYFNGPFKMTNHKTYPTIQCIRMLKQFSNTLVSLAFLESSPTMLRNPSCEGCDVQRYKEHGCKADGMYLNIHICLAFVCLIFVNAEQNTYIFDNWTCYP